MAIYHNKGYDRTVSVRETTLTNQAIDRRNTQNFNQNLLLCSSTYICIFQNHYCKNPFNQEYVTLGLRVVKLYIMQLKLLRRSRKSEKKNRILIKPKNKPKYPCMTHWIQLINCILSISHSCLTFSVTFATFGQGPVHCHALFSKPVIRLKLFYSLLNTVNQTPFYKILDSWFFE